VVVFLDFDGVTHSVSGPTFDEACLAGLDAVLADCSARVIIISSWRDELPLERLITRLRQVGRFVAGVAPEEPAFTKTPREAVVKQWLSETGYDGPWLAIDDNASWYGELAERVVAPDPRTGFGSRDAQQFREMVSRLSVDG